MERELDIAQILGMEHIGTAQAPTGDSTVAGYLAAAEQFNGFGAAARARGLKFYQHNHDGEFSFATDDPESASTTSSTTTPTRGRSSSRWTSSGPSWGSTATRASSRWTTSSATRTATRSCTSRTGGEPGDTAGYDIVEFGAGDLPYTEFLSALAGSGRRHGIWEQDNAASVAAPGYPVDSFGNAERSYVEIRSLRAERC